MTRPGAVASGAEAFVLFARRERRALVGFAWSLLGNFSAAEEVVQEALTAAWRSWDRVSSYEKPGAWVRRVVISRCTDHWRRSGREERALVRLASREHGGEVVDLPEPDAELWAAVRSLPDRQAQAVVLHYMEDLSVADIAEILDCAEGTVKAHLYRGRVSLARTLGLLADDGVRDDGEKA